VAGPRSGPPPGGVISFDLKVRPPCSCIAVVLDHLARQTLGGGSADTFVCTYRPPFKRATIIRLDYGGGAGQCEEEPVARTPRRHPPGQTRVLTGRPRDNKSAAFPDRTESLERAIKHKESRTGGRPYLGQDSGLCGPKRSLASFPAASRATASVTGSASRWRSRLVSFLGS
jgi:hypothetical protein